MNKNFQRKIVNVFLPIIFSIYVLGAQKTCLIETVLEYPQHMFWFQNKKIIFLLLLNERLV